MPTSNIPLTYACTLNGSVHLYIVIYAAQSPNFPQGVRTDATMNYIFGTVPAAGTSPYFKHYAFEINGMDSQGRPYTITDIKIHYSTHTRHILVAHLDEVDAVPSLSDQAFDVPYAYAQLGTDDHHFEAEIVLYTAAPGKKFKCVHIGPLEDDEDGHTESNITIDANATAVTVFTDSNEFEVEDVLTTDGTHNVIFTEGTPPNEKKKRSRTKNRNISVTPFPG